ncbi:aldo/keto reductase [Mesorhizobium sp. IMUNJ 23232]|uniref:aldo/keto reductase n=1 Tax=Mesorhizobium sp. IMUNJ 23232 TaxID=3376064 RepID=UPI003799CADC
MSEPEANINVDVSRRDLMKAMGQGLAAGALAGGSLVTGQAANAQEAAAGSAGAASAAPDPMIVRTLPASGDTVPAIGLGTFLTFDRIPGAPRDELKEVVRTYWDGGARMIDTSPLYGTAEYSVGAFTSELGISQQVLLSNKIWSTGEFAGDESHALRSLEQSKGRLWREQIDIMHCHSLTNVDAIVPILRAWKKEGHIRYVGVTYHDNLYHDALASWIERGVVDFVQVNYSIFNRGAENRVLPAAADKSVGVLVNMPLEKARLHKIVDGHTLPDFAGEFGAENWSQFFLKWVISNPIITCALPSTSNPEHARENIGALRGPLPDQAMRQRMIRHMETIPGFADIGKMPWYPDKAYDGTIRRAQSQIRARAA